MSPVHSPFQMHGGERMLILLLEMTPDHEKKSEYLTLTALRLANLPTTRAKPFLPLSSLPPTSLSPLPTSQNFLDAFQAWHAWSRSRHLVTFPIIGSAVACFLGDQERGRQRKVLTELLEAYRRVTTPAFLKEDKGEEGFGGRWTAFVTDAGRSVWEWKAVHELVAQEPYKT